jgi:hypothetical protein
MGSIASLLEEHSVRGPSRAMLKLEWQQNSAAQSKGNFSMDKCWNSSPRRARIDWYVIGLALLALATIVAVALVIG